MEMIRTTYHLKLVRMCLLVLFLCFCKPCSSQELPVKYTMKDGKMFIEVSKNINYHALDSFMTLYNLSDIPLKEIIKNNSFDTLKKLGWKIEANNKQFFIVSKPLYAVNDIDKPSEKIIFTQKNQAN